MYVAIVGGGLQGVELCWLARKAGWNTLLIDSRSAPPALRLADTFVQADMTQIGQLPDVQQRILQADIVIPALENESALAALGAWCSGRIPFAFDAVAYTVTSSKLRSRDLFERCLTPIPRPAGTSPDFPLIAKPSAGSGSRGVRFLPDRAALDVFLLEDCRSEWILESYCPGPSFSLEICGRPGRYATFQVTDLLMDEGFDCRGVLAPSLAPPSVAAGMESELIRLAEALSLRGLMDLEVILSEDGLHVLEIDARFPSQTPITVWLSTGINLAEQLVACFLPFTPRAGRETPRHARYEHVACRNGRLCFSGEHVMTEHGPLIPLSAWHGADEALLGGDPHTGNWAAILLFAGEEEDVLKRREQCLHELQSYTLEGETA